MVCWDDYLLLRVLSLWGPSSQSPSLSFLWLVLFIAVDSLCTWFIFLLLPPLCYKLSFRELAAPSLLMSGVGTESSWSQNLVMQGFQKEQMSSYVENE